MKLKANWKENELNSISNEYRHYTGEKTNLDKVNTAQWDNVVYRFWIFKRNNV